MTSPHLQSHFETSHLASFECSQHSSCLRDQTPLAKETRLRDFLLVYNRMTELCFLRCISNLNYWTLTREEEACLDGCAGKLVHSNHRLMGAYMQLMPSIVQRRISDYEAAAAQAVPGSGPKEVPGAAAPAALPAAVGTETHPSQQVSAGLTTAESTPGTVS
ncbi:translocase of inner mitochondrial membrane 10B [Chelydra serpentina]|uniref:Translocase of inner mitochondrial membrane 10B n=1 Tax=Chelydra serpentina TaxID=8475 RepID=A0A8T1RYJ2_CHESE|nr:translocase of inner mitochondrial membrane 10B [Chelydra serpentina]